jgi:hypothetical protein
MNAKLLIPLSALVLALMACASGVKIPALSAEDQPSPTATAAPTRVKATPKPAKTAQSKPTRPAASATPGPADPQAPAATQAAAPTTAGPTATLGPDDWQKMPILPTGISAQVKLIYQMGLLKGNNPRAFSKVGDCNIILPFFMGSFDQPGAYQLGEYSSLQGTIDYFAGSYGRKSMAAKPGMTAYSILSMLWVDQKECKASETPLTCEFRFNKPMFVILSFGTNDTYSQVNFERALRRVIELSIGNGTIPILATKADNAEHDFSINRTIASLAYEYQLPLWNFWAAVQPLPYQGLSLKDPDHLSSGLADGVNFNFSSENLQYGWTERNLSALQMLDAIRKQTENLAK